MKRIRVQLDDRIAELLEAAVPARTRKRSAFIRQATARALLEIAEHHTRAAYARAPAEEAAVHAVGWPMRSRRSAGPGGGGDREAVWGDGPSSRSQNGALPIGISW